MVADNKSSQLYLDFTRVLGTRGLNQIKAGYAGSGWSNDSEVKNPLAGIRGAIQVFGSRLPADEANARVMNEILTRIDSLDQMMKELLLFARSTANLLCSLPVSAARWPTGRVCRHVVPRSMVSEVLERAEKLMSTETELRQALREGLDPEAVYQRYGVF